MYQKTMLSILMCSLSIVPIWAKKASRPNDVVVVEPQALPELARPQAQGMVLHQLGDGRTYLYLEQQQLGRLVVLDVTDPAHIKCVGTAKLNAPAAFDFVGSLGDSAVLIRFRGNGGSAILDLRRPKAPSLERTDVFRQARFTESLGNGTFMVIDEPTSEHEMLPHDYKVVDASDPNAPNLLATIRSVREKLENPDTGTLFLLGEDGLTVLRHPHVEDEYRALDNFSN